VDGQRSGSLEGERREVERIVLDRAAAAEEAEGWRMT